MNSGITFAEWLAALEDASAPKADGFTVYDLMGRTNQSQSTIQKRLVLAQLRGEVECVGRRQERRVDGIACWRPVYRVK